MVAAAMMSTNICFRCERRVRGMCVMFFGLDTNLRLEVYVNLLFARFKRITLGIVKKLLSIRPLRGLNGSLRSDIN